MNRNVKEVKDEFLKVCKNFDIQEVYVNFDNPFNEVHQTCGDKIYVVPNQNNLGSGAVQLEFVFAPSLHSDDEDIVMSVGIESGLILKTGDEKSTFINNILNKGFKKLYSSKEGICFG